MTNGDKIRQMSDEELAGEMATRFYDCSMCPLFDIGRNCIECEKGITEWLKQEADENG